MFLIFLIIFIQKKKCRDSNFFLVNHSVSDTVKNIFHLLFDKGVTDTLCREKLRVFFFSFINLTNGD